MMTPSVNRHYSGQWTPQIHRGRGQVTTNDEYLEKRPRKKVDSRIYM